ncbi:MAG: hypothetical protein QUS08_09595, partial [Methanothrix sp.]|nr:hypothetical protein [Methanothrix sp.]
FMLSLLSAAAILAGLAQQLKIDLSGGQIGGEGLPEIGQDMILQTGLLLGLLVLLVLLITSFFTAGAIGMAREAMRRGRASTGTLWPTGRAHTAGLFAANILVGLITAAGLLLLLPGIALSGSQAWAELPLVICIILLIIYALIVSLALSAAPYALVLEGLGPVQAIMASVEFFIYNKFDVLILWLVVLALSAGVQMAAGAFAAEGPAATYIAAAAGLVELVVLSPLSTLWWTRLYMSRRGLLEEEVMDPW